MAVKGITVVHAIPCRLRLKVDKVKGDPVFAQKAEDILGQVSGIERVEAKPLTGSVLIYYDLAKLLAAGAFTALTDGFAALFPEIEKEAFEMEAESLMGHLATGGVPQATGGVPQPTLSSVESLAALNAKVAELTGGLDLKLLAPLALLFLGFRSLWTSKQRTFPAWYDYLWFGFSAFVMLNLRNSKAKPDLKPEGPKHKPGS
ncbi:MAG: hypothetical protein P8X58_09915 [Syntrophobacterales bacterium]